VSNLFEYEKSFNDGIVLVKITGNIDEDFTSEGLFEEEAKVYHFDFDKLNSINSCGIREWIIYLEKIAPSCQVVYENCPVIMIEQMNVVQGILPKDCKVMSFYAPYYCEDCDEEVLKLLRPEDIKNNEAPVFDSEIEGCKCTLELDAIEGQFFQFLERV
jgi:hypothetical protein